MKLGLGCAVLATMAALSGCASAVRVSDSIRLKEDAGIIVYRVSCGEGIAWAEFHKAGDKSKGYLGALSRAGVLRCPDGVQSQQLEAGRYFVSKIGYESFVDFGDEDALQFNVEPGRLNYIGHIHLPSRVEPRKGASRLILISDPIVRDRQEEVRTWLNTNHPSLIRRYELIPALAQLPKAKLESIGISSSNTPEHNSALSPASEQIMEMDPVSSATAGQTVVAESSVILEVLVDVEGRAKDGRIAQSSGNSQLDTKALEQALANWKFKPGTKEGKPVEDWVSIRVKFRLVE